jgi:hypothetical protein
MSKYVVDPLLVDKAFGVWILLRRFVDTSQGVDKSHYIELSGDEQVLVDLTCVSDFEFTFSIAFHMDRVEDLPDIVDQLMQQMHFSKDDMLETTKLIIPQIKQFAFVFCSNHTLTKLPKPIEGVTIEDLSNEERGVWFKAIFI